MTYIAPSPLIRGIAVTGAGTLVLALSMTALASTSPSSGSVTTSIDTSVLASYAVLAGTAVTSTGATVLNADLGVSPGAAATGFPPGIVNGSSHLGDASAAAAQVEAARAYAALAARPPTGIVAPELGGTTLQPGTYAVSGPATLAGALTLDAGGDAGADFVVQVGTSLDAAAQSSVVLANGAQPCHVYWQVGDSATVGAGSSFVGNILASGSVALGDHGGLDGRAFALSGSVTLASNAVVQSPCKGGSDAAPTESPSPTDSPSESPSPTESPSESPSPTDSPTDPPGGTQPNIVFVLVDDLSENLLPYMTEVQAMAADGIRFEDFYASTPWCCPSRATYQTGQYPHNTGVRSNNYPHGGFGNFIEGGGIDASIGVEMQASGYRTGFMGKYLNGYKLQGQEQEDEPYYPADFVPPGWNDWFSGATGYQAFKYQAVESIDGSAPVEERWSGAASSNYYTDVLSAKAQSFVTADHDEPFFLMLTPFAPHIGGGDDPQGRAIKYPPAPRDRAVSAKAPKKWTAPQYVDGDCGVVACADVPWPDSSTPGNFNMMTTNPLGWMSRGVLSDDQLEREHAYHLQRIQMVQSINDMLAGIRQTLADTGQADNTYIVFGSDNGYHLGEHALYGGKTTAYDHDVRTPLIVHPPGGTGAPVTIDAIVQNTDVFPTFLRLAGATPGSQVDGVSLLPLIGDSDIPWRANAYLELTNDKHDDMARSNPDTRGFEGDHVAPTYNAIRTGQYLYVDYTTMDAMPPGENEAEFYDLASDPYEINNRWAEVTPEQRLLLNDELASQVTCAGAACFEAQAAVPDVTLPPLP